jgi:integrase/recombinase XerD
MAVVPELAAEPPIQAVNETALDPVKLLLEFEGDCKDRHLTDETIGRYKSPLKLFFAFLRERNQTILDVDKHVLKDFIHFRREQGVDQKTLENNFTALSTFYEFLCFEGYANVNPVLPVRKRYLKRYKDENDNESFDESARKLASVEDMAMLVHSILSIRDQAVVITLAKTGLRRSELASIDVEDDNSGDINWIEQSLP